mmetsp:Transcript_7580/g.11276  ORF Transcript_7580/g.11276 Transcript_7580/m.11276 type:complete len:200 (-) Transcript_7580:32-631(-)
MSEYTALNLEEEKEEEVGGDDIVMISDRDLNRGRISSGSWASNRDLVMNWLSQFRELRPWAEFLSVKNLSIPAFSDLRDRIVGNFKYYKSNYVQLLILLFFGSFFTHPLSLLGLAIVALGYYYMFMYSQSNLTIAGFELDTSQNKTIALVLFGCIVFWMTGVGGTLYEALIFFGFFSSLHAGLKRNPNEADFETSPSAV